MAPFKQNKSNSSPARVSRRSRLGAGFLLFTSHLFYSSLCFADSPDLNSFLSGWGVGIAFVNSDREIVSNASIVDGVVRVTDGQRNSATLLVAKHWYFSGHRLRSPDPVCTVGFWGGCLGLMAGVGVGSTGTGSSQVISLIGGGLIYGWNRDNTDVQKAGHNLGIGIGRSFGVQTLGNGFHADAAPPAGETQVRYQKSDVRALFIFYTYSWGK
jgi:hypothetical protein